MLADMPRLHQVPRSETDDPIVNGMYDLLFDTGVDLDALIGAVDWMQSDELLGRITPGLLSRAGLFPMS